MHLPASFHEILSSATITSFRKVSYENKTKISSYFMLRFDIVRVCFST